MRGGEWSLQTPHIPAQSHDVLCVGQFDHACIKFRRLFLRLVPKFWSSPTFFLVFDIESTNASIPKYTRNMPRFHFLYLELSTKAEIQHYGFFFKKAECLLANAKQPTSDIRVQFIVSMSFSVVRKKRKQLNFSNSSSNFLMECLILIIFF